MVSDLLLSTSAGAASAQAGHVSGDGESREPSVVRKASGATERCGSSQDAASLEAVYQEHFRFVWRCLRHLGVRDANLDDAVQEVFLVVDKKLAGFDGNLRSWLYAIVRRIALRHRTRERTEASRFVTEETIETRATHRARSSDLREELEKRERLRLAIRALEVLDDPKREVFVFCMIEGLSAPEVAQIVGVPLNTVYSRLRAARLEFSDVLSRIQNEERHTTLESTERASSTARTAHRRKP